MKMNLILGAMALASTPLALAAGNATYPSEKVAAFVVEKLDVTSLPSAIRPKKEKGKRTLAEYGYTAQKIAKAEAIVETTGEGKLLSFKVLDYSPSGIYVCVAVRGQNDGETRTQSVVLLKRKNSNALLKGRESSREFASCPVIGGDDSTSNSY